MTRMNAARDPRKRPDPARRPWLSLMICCMSLFIVGIDVTIINVALPTINDDLHPGVSGLQWVIDAYMLVLASFMLLSGSTADRIGRRRTFQIGLLVFVVGSAACGLSTTIGELIACRVLQAIGGSMLNPVALSIIRNIFTDSAQRARALGIWSAAFGLAMGVGPLIGGVILGLGWGWRPIFWVNVPIGLAAIVLTQLFVPESRARIPRRFDMAGQLLSIAFLATLIYAIIEVPHRGWLSAPVASSFCISLVSLAALIVVEVHRCEPLVSVRLFANRAFSVACLITVLTFASFSGLLWINTLYLQDVRGERAFVAGLLMTPMSAMALLSSPIAGALTARHGNRPPLMASGIMLLASGLMMTVLQPDTRLWWLLGAYVIFGAGFGLIGPPVNATALEGLPAAQAGVAGALAATFRQIGQALGVAIVGSIVAAGLHGSLRTGLIGASHPVWWIIAACGILVIILSLAEDRRIPAARSHVTGIQGNA